MGKIVWKNGNKGFNKFGDLDEYTLVSSDATKMVFEYDEDQLGDFDDERYPWRVEFKLTGATMETPEDGGERDGEALYTGGTISGMKAFNAEGDLILDASKLSIPLAVFQSYLLDERGYNIEHLIFSGGHKISGSNDGGRDDWDGDSIRTGAGKDVVKAKGGNDYITDGGGADKYIGGDGNDTVNYDDWYHQNTSFVSSGIVVNLAKKKITGPDGATDKVKSIERVIGTFLDDDFTGDKNDNGFYGMAGNDSFDGGAGFDWVSYRKDEDQGGNFGIRADLGAGVIRDGFRATDTVKNIEGVEGTDLRDVFIDDANGNWLSGRDGNDVFRVSEGDDYLQGGDGADKFIFRGDDIGDNTITDFDASEGDTIAIENLSSAEDVIITEVDGSLMIEWQGNTIELRDFDGPTLTASDLGL